MQGKDLCVFVTFCLIPCSRKLSQRNFCEFNRENFLGLLAGVTKGYHAPNFFEKTFVNRHKTLKFTKVFSLKVSYCAVVTKHQTHYLA